MKVSLNWLKNYIELKSTPEELANTLTSIIGIEIEPYHAFGENKYMALGKQPLEISMQTDEQINEILRGDNK